MLRKSSPPIEPRRFDAPTTATELGWKKGSSDAAHSDVVAGRHLLPVAACRRDREADLDLAAFAGARDREAGVAEDVDHRVVLVQHLGHELLDPGVRRLGCELLEQPGADPAALVVVADREGDLGGARVAQPDPVREGDDAPVEGAEQRALFVPVGVENRFDELRAECREAVEAEVAAVLREGGEELEERVGILRGGWSQPERRPVAEDDVGRGDSVRRGCAHAATACSRACCGLRTTSTGQGAEWTSPVETLPEKSRRAAPQPCEPTTISCAPESAACRQISSTTRPSAITVEHDTPSASAASVIDPTSSATRLCSASVSSATTFE